MSIYTVHEVNIGDEQELAGVLIPDATETGRSAYLTADPASLEELVGDWRRFGVKPVARVELDGPLAGNGDAPDAVLHAITAIEAVGPSEPGALAGFEARCTCGFVARTSLSASDAANQAAAHIAYFSGSR